MEIENIPIIDIIPYKNNPRKNDKGVDILVKSIKKFGFLVPIILDDKNIIVSGHTRIKAAIKLKLETVPVIYTENLSDDQIKAFRIMDNKSHELSEWNYNLLKEEFHDLEDTYSFDYTGFEVPEITEIWEKEIIEPLSTESMFSNKTNIFKHICPKCGYEFEETIKKSSEREIN